MHTFCIIVDRPGIALPAKANLGIQLIAFRISYIILRRAEKRGKELPQVLKTALERQANA